MIVFFFFSRKLRISIVNCFFRLFLWEGGKAVFEFGICLYAYRVYLNHPLPGIIGMVSIFKTVYMQRF